MWMAGYASRDHVAEGKLTDLWAKALVLQSERGQRGLLVTLDLIGIDRELALAMRGEICEKLGFRPREIVFCTSHTHTGPVVAENLRPMHYALLDAPQRELVSQYALFVRRQVLQVAGDALESIQPVTLAHGNGRATFAVNRRNNRESDVPRLRETQQLVGPVDHDVPVLAVRNKADGRLSAVAFGYACHATVLSSYKWSGDYPGFAQMALEKKNADCIALFWAGCGADQNPLPRRSVNLAKEYGGRLADAVQNVLDGEMSELSPDLQTVHNEIPLALESPPSLDEIERDANSEDRFVSSRATYLLRRIQAGDDIGAAYPYPVASWRLGENLGWVFLGGEVVVDFAIRLKGEMHGAHTWVASYSNDVMAYIPSRRVLREGGYEGGGAMVYYGLPARWEEDVEQRIVREVHQQSE